MDVQVKLIELQGVVDARRQRLATAEKAAADNPKRDKDSYYQQQVETAKTKLFEAENKLLAMQTQVEREKGVQEEKTRQSDQDSADIVIGLQAYFGEEAYEDLEEEYGDPVEPTRNGWVLNDAFFGGALLLGRTMLFSPNYQEFYEYHANNGLWAPITEDVLTFQLQKLLVKLNRIVFKNLSILKHVNEKFRHAAIQAQHGELEKREAFIKKKPKHIQVANGVLDFAESVVTLKAFSPNYYSLCSTPLAYNSNAECPNFMALMAHVPEEIDLIQRAGGMFLLGRNIAQKIFLFEGKGRTRKTTIAKVFQLVLGTDAVTQLRTEHLNDRFEMYRIYQKSLLIGSDVPANFLSQEGAAALKRITGGDPLTAEGKNLRQGFEFDGNLNVLITSNSQLLLKLQTDAEAWKSRLVLVLFPSIENAPPQKGDYWDHLFQTEGEGILRWMVDGANKVLRDFAEDRGFVLTDAQRERVNARIDESDSLDVFLTACLAEDPGNRMGIATDDLVAAYGKFCIGKKWKQPVGTSKQLPEAMARLFGSSPGNHAHKTGSSFEVRGYLGVKWIEVSNGNASTDEPSVSVVGPRQDTGVAAVRLLNRIR
jgi:putative DNA primase/helicase